MKDEVSNTVVVGEIFLGILKFFVEAFGVGILLFLLSSIFGVPAANGQSHAAVAAPAVVEARTSVVHPAARPAVAQRVPSTPFMATPISTTSARAPRVVVLSQNSAFSFDDGFSNFAVPGQGFDFAHLAAINAGAGVRALIDPVTQHELALLREIRRETPQGIAFFPGFFPMFEQSAPQPSQPMIIIVPQAAPPAEQYPERSRAQVVETPVAPPPPVEPAHEAGDFVLVRRDGGLLFAVAFTQGAERITYITRDGVRRGLTLADLDTEATVRMNEERGTPLQFSR